MAKVTVLPNGCWEWTGATNKDGYGLFFLGGGARKFIAAHRWAYSELVEPIPQGLHLDHTCHTDDPSCNSPKTCPHRRCVSPAHLEPVTQRENNRRIRRTGMPKGTKLEPRDICLQGHPLEDGNVFVGKDGRRRCRTCMRAKNRRSKASPAGQAREARYAQSKRRKTYLTQYRQDHAEHNRQYQKQRWAEQKETIEAHRAAKKAAETPEEREGRLARQREHTRRYRAKAA